MSWDEVLKLKRKKWQDAVDKLMQDGRERSARLILDNDVINQRRHAPFVAAITGYLASQARKGNYSKRAGKIVGERMMYHYKWVGDEDE